MTGKASAHLLESQSPQGHLFDPNALKHHSKTALVPQLAALDSKALLSKMAKKQLAKLRRWLCDQTNQLKIRSCRSPFQRLTTSRSPQVMHELLGEMDGHLQQRRTWERIFRIITLAWKREA